MVKNKRSRGKTFLLITFILAILSLIAGLLFPITVSTFSNGINFNEMPILQLGSAFSAFGVPVKSGAELTEAYSYSISVFNRNFDIGAALLIFYASATAVALILLIPAFLLKPKSAAKVIFFSELLALTPLFAMTAAETYRMVGDWNLSVLIPFGIVLLCVVLQSFAVRRGSGFIKFVLFSLSAASVLLAATNIYAIFPAGETFAQSFVSALKGRPPFNTGLGLFEFNGENVYGSSLIKSLFAGDLTFGAAGLIAIACGLALSIVGLAVINLYLDILGLGKKTNGFMLVCNVIRYSLQILLIFSAAIVTALSGGNFGILLYLIFIISAIQLILQIVRLSIFSKKKKAGKDKKTSKEKETSLQNEEYQYGQSQKNISEPAVVYAEPITVFTEQPIKADTQELAVAAKEQAVENAISPPELAPAEERPIPLPSAVNENIPTAEKEDYKPPFTEFQEPVLTFDSALPELIVSESEIISETADTEIAQPAEKIENLSSGEYAGPNDDFINKLSEEQKSEFVNLFIDNKANKIANIPDYVVGGDNTKFFSLLFIYFSRVRDIVTDGLMDKFYEQVKFM